MIPNKDIKYNNINDFYINYKEIEGYLGLEVFNKLNKSTKYYDSSKLFNLR